MPLEKPAKPTACLCLQLFMPGLWQSCLHCNISVQQWGILHIKENIFGGASLLALSDMVAEGICAWCAWNTCINVCFYLEQTIHLNDGNTHSHTVQNTHDLLSSMGHKHKMLRKYLVSVGGTGAPYDFCSLHCTYIIWTNFIILISIWKKAAKIFLKIFTVFYRSK